MTMQSSGCAAWSCCSHGVSAWHGPHHGAQKFRTTALPRNFRGLMGLPLSVRMSSASILSRLGFLETFDRMYRSEMATRKRTAGTRALDHGDRRTGAGVG